MDLPRLVGIRRYVKPLLSAQQVTHAHKLLEQGERPAHIAELINALRYTLERALEN